MNVFIIILLVIVTIIAILLIIGLFLKNEFTIVREISIDKSIHHVFGYIKYLKNQDNYSKWVMADPAMKKSYIGTDGTHGFIYAWESENKKVGQGEQEILKISEGVQIDCEIRFVKPFAGIAQTYMATKATGGNKTQLKWVFINTMKYPTNIMSLFLNFDKLLGGDMETSLDRLKKNLEG